MLPFIKPKFQPKFCLRLNPTVTTKLSSRYAVTGELWFCEFSHYKKGTGDIKNIVEDFVEKSKIVLRHFSDTSLQLNYAKPLTTIHDPG